MPGALVAHPVAQDGLERDYDSSPGYEAGSTGRGRSMRTLIPTFIALLRRARLCDGGERDHQRHARRERPSGGRRAPGAAGVLRRHLGRVLRNADRAARVHDRRALRRRSQPRRGDLRVDLRPGDEQDATVGTWHADPEFSQRARQSARHRRSSCSTRPSRGSPRPPARRRVACTNLSRDQQFTPVGYGAQSVTSGKGGKIFHYADVRFAAVGTLNADHPVVAPDLAESVHRKRWYLLRRFRRPELPRCRRLRRRTSSPGSRSPATRRAARPTSTTGSTRPLHARSSAST